MELLALLGLNLSTLVLILILLVTCALWWRKGEKTLPGPRGLPYIGSLVDVVRSTRDGKFEEFSSDLYKRYGPICFVKVGVQRFVYISDGKLMADLFQREEFSLRPVETFPLLARLNRGSSNGLIFANGDSHKEMRKFALLALKDLGVGTKSLDEMIQSEAGMLCRHLENLAETRDGVVDDIKIKMQHATANVIHHIIFGFRHDYDNPKWKALVQMLCDFFSINGLEFPQNYLPVLEKIPPLDRYLSNGVDEKLSKIYQEVEKYIYSQIEEHRSSYCEGEIRDFIDLYLKYEMEHRDFYTKKNIFAVMMDLFRAGTDMTATALSWVVMYLVKEPDIQRQLREEIDEVVGDRVFDRQDIDKLVKIRAFINEIYRYTSIAPVVPGHTVSKPVQVRDYTLVPGDVVIGNLFAMHYDKEYWKDPETFRIDRWINSKGEFLKHNGFFYPFSVGKRVCPGRQLATIKVTLILVEFLQRFTFEKAEEYDDISDKPIPGFFRAPKSFHFKVVKR